MMDGKDKKSDIYFISIITIWVLVGISVISIFSLIERVGHEEINSEIHEMDKMDTFQTESRSIGSRGLTNSVWPKFCGDMKNTGLSKYDTSKNIGKLLWKYETDDIIHTDPVIGPDGTIYIGSDDYYFYAFNPNGTVKWKYYTGSEIRLTPAIDSNGIIYVIADDVFALFPNGKLKWQKDIGTLHSSIAIGPNGILYMGGSKYLYAINQDGSVKWKFGVRDTNVPNTPAIDDNGSLYFGSVDYFHAVYPNGTAKWELKIKEGPIYSSPAIDPNGIIYFGSGYYIYAVYPNGTVKWKYNAGATVSYSPAIGPDGTIYCGTSGLRALTPTGIQKWNAFVGAHTGSPVVGSDGTIYIGSSYNGVYAIRPNGAIKWKFDTEKRVYSTPAISSKGTIYVGSLDWYFYAIGGNVSVGNKPPVANAGPDQNVKINETVFFNGSKSYDPNNDNLTYKWNFADGNSTGWQNSSNTSHLYGVTLDLSGDYNETSSMSGSTHSGELTFISKKILIETQVIFNGTFTVKGDLIINGSLVVYGKLIVTGSTSITPNGTLTYGVNLTVSDGLFTDWDMCRITISKAGVNHAPVVKAGSDQNVKVNQTVKFDGCLSYDPDGDTLTYNWDFGDGTTTGWLSSYGTSHSYKSPGNYTVILTASDGSLSGNDTCIIRVSGPGSSNTPPVANAGSDQNVKVNQTVNLDGSGSYDPDGDPLIYKWDFNDGTATGWLSSSKTSHSYKRPGNYTVILKVSDGSLTDTDTCIINVSVTAKNNTSPVANAGSNQNVKVNQTVNFNGSSSYDPDGDILIYKWDFGDGTSTGWLNSSKISHSYRSSGIYIVTLTVSDGSLNDTDTCKIRVTGFVKNNTSPIANAGLDQNVKVNQIVNLNGSGSYDPEGGPLTYKWNFGDGISTSWLSSTKTSHSYKRPGNYTVTLTVSDGSLTDNDTCIIRVTGTVKNNTSPIANAGSDQKVKVNQTVNLDGSGSYDLDGDRLTYKWDFGDNTTTGWLSSSKTSHSYKNPGNYTVTLTVSDGKLLGNDICIIHVLKPSKNLTSPKIISSSIQQNSQNISINISDVTIIFSKPMNRSSVEHALSISPTINYSILWRENNTKLIIIFTENLSYNTTYMIIFDTTFKDVNGNYMKNPYKLEFVTEAGHQEREDSHPSDEPKDGLKPLKTLNLLWIISLLIIIVIIILLLIIKNKRKIHAKNDDDFQESIERHELHGGKLAEDIYLDEEFTKFSNEVIKELKKESLSLKKPSDFKLSNDEMLKKLNKQYHSGQLSRATYNSIRDTLTKLE